MKTEQQAYKIAFNPETKILLECLLQKHIVKPLWAGYGLSIPVPGSCLQAN